jgi:RNA polymerase sigma-70 factor (ECF subfamily)
MDHRVKVETPQARDRALESPTPDSARAPTLEELYREHFQFIWRTARRLGVRPAQLDDVVHEVFLVVHRQLPTYEARSAVRAWLFSIARRVAADHRRSVRRKGRLLQLHMESSTARCDDPLRDAMNKERSDVIIEFLASVDEPLREAFMLCELEQMSAPEIADAVHASLPAVYSRIRTARQAFVRYVQDQHPELMGENDG